MVKWNGMESLATGIGKTKANVVDRCSSRTQRRKLKLEKGWKEEKEEPDGT